MSFQFNEKETGVLQNFAGINPSMIVDSKGFKVINNAKSVIGFYSFEKPYDFEDFGLYETNEFLTILKALESPEIEVSDKYLSISTGKDKVKYFTTAQNLLPKVPDVSKKFSDVECEMVFSLSADKLNLLLKMAGILKSKFLFFETDKKKIRITAGDELESSGNNFEVVIEEGITSNKLTEPVKIILADFKIMPGEYKVQLSTKISKWECVNGVDYYVGVAAI